MVRKETVTPSRWLGLAPSREGKGTGRPLPHPAQPVIGLDVNYPRCEEAAR